MEVLSISLGKHLSLVISCSNVILIIAVCLIGLYFLCFLIRNKLWRKEVNVDEIELGIGNQKITLKPNYQTVQVAYKLWVELSTRKLGLPIDEDNDVITEIYDSWYSFFGIARELIKEIPANNATNKDTKELIILSSKILNQAVRPHLTKWQARYREWYARYLKSIDNYDVSPQELQKKFKCINDENCYTNLMKDLKKVNKKLINYRKLLEKIVFGEELNN